MVFPDSASHRRQVRYNVLENDWLSLPVISPPGPNPALRLGWIQESMKAKNTFPKARFGSSRVQSKYLHKADAQIKISANNSNQAVI